MMDLSTLTFTKIKDNPKLVDQSFSLYKTSVVPDKASVEVTEPYRVCRRLFYLS